MPRFDDSTTDSIDKLTDAIERLIRSVDVGPGGGRGGGTVGDGGPGGQRGDGVRPLGERFQRGLGATIGAAGIGAGLAAAGIGIDLLSDAASAGVTTSLKGGSFGTGVRAHVANLIAGSEIAGRLTGIGPDVRDINAASGATFGQLQELAAAGVEITDEALATFQARNKLRAGRVRKLQDRLDVATSEEIDKNENVSNFFETIRGTAASLDSLGQFRIGFNSVLAMTVGKNYSINQHYDLVGPRTQR